ncbi:hypothetical protein DFH27DRAFT_529781 [Peziza echinospora]|nr:hypothetical protein DFH27DRAFT_529781 [Peziza echinospora]
MTKIRSAPRTAMRHFVRPPRIPNRGSNTQFLNVLAQRPLHSSPVAPLSYHFSYKDQPSRRSKCANDDGRGEVSVMRMKRPTGRGGVKDGSDDSDHSGRCVATVMGDTQRQLTDAALFLKPLASKKRYHRPHPASPPLPTPISCSPMSTFPSDIDGPPSASSPLRPWKQPPLQPRPSHSSDSNVKGVPAQMVGKPSRPQAFGLGNFSMDGDYRLYTASSSLTDFNLPRLQSLLAEFRATDLPGIFVPDVSYVDFLAWNRLILEREKDKLGSLRAEYYLLPRGGYGVLLRAPGSPYHNAVGNHIMSNMSAALDAVGVPNRDGLFTCVIDEPFYLSALPHDDCQTRTKQPDLAIIPTPEVATTECADIFPTVVFEVGFSQGWESLMEDARLFLMGTGGVTTLVVLVKLDENPKTPDLRKLGWPSRRDVLYPNEAEQEHEDTEWYASLGVAPPPAHITLEESWDPPVVASKKTELRRWYIACEAKRLLRSPLVGAISGRMAYVRRHEIADSERSAAPPSRSPRSTSSLLFPDLPSSTESDSPLSPAPPTSSDVDSSLSPAQPSSTDDGQETIVLSQITLFLENDQIINDTSAMLRIPLPDLLGPEHPLVLAAAARNEILGAVEFSLAQLGQAILNQRRRMQDCRAHGRAQLVVEQAIDALQRAEEAEARRVEEEAVEEVAGERRPRRSARIAAASGGKSGHIGVAGVGGETGEVVGESEEK